MWLKANWRERNKWRPSGAPVAPPLQDPLTKMGWFLKSEEEAWNVSSSNQHLMEENTAPARNASEKLKYFTFTFYDRLLEISALQVNSSHAMENPPCSWSLPWESDRIFGILVCIGNLVLFCIGNLDPILVQPWLMPENKSTGEWKFASLKGADSR